MHNNKEKKTIENIITSNDFDSILNLIDTNTTETKDIFVSFEGGVNGNLLHYFILSDKFTEKQLTEIITLLLKKGHFVNQLMQREKNTSAEIFTPLQLAILQEKYYLIDILLENNADPNQPDGNPDKWTPLLYIIDSSLNDEQTCIQINKFLKAGAIPTNYNRCEKTKEKPKSLKTIKEWLQQRFFCDDEKLTTYEKSNKPELNGWLPIFHKIKEGNLHDVIKLIKDFADIYKRDKNGWSSFHYAVLYNQPDIFEELLIHSVPQQNKYYDKNGWGPLHLACDYNNTLIIDLIVKKNCNDLLHKDNNGNNPINIAAAKGNFYPLELAVKHNLNIFENLNHENETFIDIAIKSGFFKEISDNLVAMEKKHKVLTKLILDSNLTAIKSIVSKHLLNKDILNVLLITAIRYNQIKAVKLLIEYGANISSISSQDIDLPNIINNTEMLEFLVKHGFNLNSEIMRVTPEKLPIYENQHQFLQMLESLNFKESLIRLKKLAPDYNNEFHLVFFVAYAWGSGGDVMASSKLITNIHEFCKNLGVNIKFTVFGQSDYSSAIKNITMKGKLDENIKCEIKEKKFDYQCWFDQDQTGWYDFLQESSVKSTLASANMVISYPTYHYFTGKDKKLLADILSKHNTPMLAITEYDFQEKVAPIDSLKFEEFRLGIGGMGVLIKEDLHPLDIQHIYNSEDQQTLLTIFNSSDTIKNIKEINLPHMESEYALNNNLFFAYFAEYPEEELASDNVLNVEYFVVMCILKSLRTDPKKNIDIFVPVKKEHFSKIIELLKNNNLLSEQEKELIGKITILNKDNNTGMSESSSKTFSSNHENQVDVRLINGFRLQNSTMLHLIEKSQLVIGATGDQSLYEGILSNKLVMYQALNWKALQFKNIIKICEQHSLHSLAEFYKLQLKNKDVPVIDNYKKIVEILINKPENLKKEATQLADIIRKEHKLNLKLENNILSLLQKQIFFKQSVRNNNLSDFRLKKVNHQFSDNLQNLLKEIIPPEIEFKDFRLLQLSEINIPADKLYKKHKRNKLSTTTSNEKYSVMYLRSKDHNDETITPFVFCSDFLLGRGALARVKVAQNANTGEWVAVKILSNTNKHESIEKEKELLKINNQYIGSIEYNSKIYIFQKYLQGKTLEESLCDNQPKFLNLSSMLQCAITCLKSINNLHENGFIHTDLHPGNFMLDYNHNACIPFDFGNCVKLKKDNFERKVYGRDAYFLPPDFLNPSMIRGAYKQRKPVHYNKNTDLYACSMALLNIFSGMQFCDRKFSDNFNQEKPLLGEVNFIPHCPYADDSTWEKIKFNLLELQKGNINLEEIIENFKKLNKLSKNETPNHSEGWTLLHEAAASFDKDKIVKLINLGYNPFLKDADGIRPIDLAVHSIETQKVIINSMKQYYKLHPYIAFKTLENAIINNKIDIIEQFGIYELIDFNLQHNISLSGSNFFTFLITAVRKNYPKMVELLITYGANPDLCDQGGWSPLHHAIDEDKNLELIEKLLDLGAFVKQDILQLAIKKHSQSKDVNKQNIEAIIKLLIKYIPENNYLEILVEMIYRNNGFAVSCMLENLENNALSYKLTDPNGWGLIHQAARFSTPEILNIILNKNYDGNIKNNNGNTALHIIAATEKPGKHFNNNIKLLLENNADPFIKNKDGLNAIDLALQATNQKFIEELLKVYEKDHNLKGMYDKVLKAYPELNLNNKIEAKTAVIEEALQLIHNRIINLKDNKINISPGEALLLLIQEHSTIKKEKKLLCKLYLTGFSSKDELSKFKAMCEDSSLLAKYNISYNPEVINKDANRRYFESHFCFETMKRSITELDLSLLKGYYTELEKLFINEHKYIDKVFTGKFSDQSVNEHKEYADSINRIQSEPQFIALEEKDKEKMLLLVKCCFLSVVAVRYGDKNEKQFPQFPINIYGTGYYSNQARGKIPKIQENTSSSNYGIMQNFMPLPIDDLAFTNNSFKYVKPSDIGMPNYLADWPVMAFDYLVHPFVNSISGTMLANIRAMSYLKSNDKFVLNDIKNLKNYFKSLIVTMSFLSGGHSLFEFSYPLFLKEVKEFFKDIKGFDHLSLDTLFFQDNQEALDVAISRTIDYNKMLLNKQELHAELLKKKSISIEDSENHNLITLKILKKILNDNGLVEKDILQLAMEKHKEIKMLHGDLSDIRKIIIWLIENNLDIKSNNHLDTDGNFFKLLLETCREERGLNAKYIELLNIYPEFRLNSKEIPLHKSILDNNIHKMTEILNKYPLLINQSDKNGNTALHLLVKNRSQQKLRKFLEFNPNLNVKDKDGKTPLEICEDPNIRKILEKKIHQKKITYNYQKTISKSSEQVIIEPLDGLKLPKSNPGDDKIK